MVKKNDFFIIAHRGESFNAPENTMAAINLAWERRAEAVEIDVHLSRDKKVVVIHDYNTKRLAGVNKKVKDQSVEQLKKLDVGSWKDTQWKGEQIPTLKEILDSVPDEKKIVIEIKSDSSIIPYLKNEIEQLRLSNDQIELIGFNLKTMALAKKEFSDHKVLWLLDLDYVWINRVFKPSIVRAIALAKKYNLDGLNVWAGKMLDQSMIHQVHKAGLLVYCWTVNDIQKAQNLMDWNIDAITTDRAQWLKSQLKKPKTHNFI